MITNYGICFIILIIISFIYGVYVISSVKSKNKLIDFALVFWLLTHQIFKSKYAWREAPKLAMFRKFDHFLAWALFTFVILKFISNKKPSPKLKMLDWEKYFYWYIGLTVFLYYLHNYLGNISLYKTIAFSRLYIVGGVLFFSLSRVITKELLSALFKTIIFAGVLSSIVSMYQFFVDSKFLRLAAFYDAFGSYDRASGIFMWPYDNGIFLLLAIFTVSYTIRNRRIKVVLISLFIVNVILTYTRGVWLALILVSLIHGSDDIANSCPDSHKYETCKAAFEKSHSTFLAKPSTAYMPEPG